MKINPNRIYPYPVFSESSDDYNGKGLPIEADLSYDSETAYITVKTAVEDKKLSDMLENDVCGLFCHIESSTTKYRELFELAYAPDKTEYKLTIPLYKLNDVVEILCVLVIKEDFTGFTDENLNELYKDELIKFPRYATIGYSDTVEVMLNKRIDVNGDVPSIISINKSETDNSVSYDFTPDHIVIYLPAEQHQIYFDYIGQGIRIKQMMLIFPVLIDIINTLKESAEGFEDHAWYQVLNAAFQKYGFENGIEDANFKNTETLKLAQLLLGEICKDAFNEFDTMNQDRA